MAWLQLSVNTQHPEFAEELLLSSGAVSVTLIDAADTPVLEPLPGETPLWANTITIGLFEENTDIAPVEALLRETLDDGAELTISNERIDDQDWVRNCLDSLQAMHFGGRLWICPHNREVTAENAVVVMLDPGLAFGTGTHPTTMMCLQWIAENLDSENNPVSALSETTVVDYGCGSGILAIAALKMGAKQAWVTDIDPQAKVATRENARVNGVADRLHWFECESSPPQQANVVFSNILSGPLIELAPKLTNICADSGYLILAGLLSRQHQDVADAYAGDFTFSAKEFDDWTRLSGQKLTNLL